MRRLPLALTLVFVLTAPRVRAGGAVAVETNDATCLGRGRLAAEIASRGARLEPQARVRLGVRIEMTTAGVAVDVTGQNDRSPLSQRHLDADSCEDALTAVALIAALAVADDAAPVDGPLDPPEPDAAGVDVEPATSVYGAVGWSAASFASGQMGPRIALGRSTRRTFLPWYEGAASAMLTRTLNGGGGRADLSWLTLRGALAPIGRAIGTRGMASVYGMLEAGALVAAGGGVTTNATRTLPWLAVGAGARLHWDLGAWIVAAEAGVKAPFSRDELVFVNGGSVYRMPALGGEGAIVMGMHFP